MANGAMQKKLMLTNKCVWQTTHPLSVARLGETTQKIILYNVNVFVRSDNTVILEVKWDNDADGTLTAMFSENDTEQMVFTLVLAIINAKK